MVRTSSFVRYPAQGYIAGVCAGIGDYLGWNAKWIRVLAVLTFFFGGGFPVLLVYAVLWYLMDPADGRPGEPRFEASRAQRFREAGCRGAQRARDHLRPSELKARFSRLEERLRCMEECVASNEYELRRELRKLEG